MKLLTHLTVAGNRLTTLPREISGLAGLIIFDLSSNVLEELPKEIGDLIGLRELHLRNNKLRTLPYELGKLFQLQKLTIDGNPLTPEFNSLAHDPQSCGNLSAGKLLTYLLDNLQGKLWTVAMHYPSSVSVHPYSSMCSCRLPSRLSVCVHILVCLCLNYSIMWN